MTTPKKPSEGKRKQGLSPRQRRLIAQEPAVQSGRKSRKQAMIDAGYSPESARQQGNVYGALRRNQAMQEALDRAGFTDDYLAKGIVEGTRAVVKTEFGSYPDHRARAQFYNMGAKIRDVFPLEKQMTIPATIDDLIKAQEAGSPAADETNR